MNEQQARKYIRKLRSFYSGVLIYAAVNLALILIWAISGGGYFWPIWVIIVWGIGLGVHAFSLGLIPQVNAIVPFMTPEWEEQEVRKLMKSDYKAKEEKKETKVVVRVEKVPPKKKTKTVRLEKAPPMKKTKISVQKKAGRGRPKKQKA